MPDTRKSAAYEYAEEALKLRALPGDMMPLALVEGVIGMIMFPPIIPFAIAAAVIMVPIAWIGERFRRSSELMPQAWYPLVAATASRDGRFLVGRILSSRNDLTLAEAVTFMAAERVVEDATDLEDTAAQASVNATDLQTPEAAKAALRAFYGSERSAFDKAMAGIGSSASMIGSLAGSAASAALRKWRVGF